MLYDLNGVRAGRSTPMAAPTTVVGVGRSNHEKRQNGGVDVAVFPIMNVVV